MKTRQKILLSLLAVYCVFAIVMICIKAQKSYCDEIIVLMYICSILGAIMVAAGIWKKSKLDSRPIVLKESNGEKPSSLYTFLGIGQTLAGGFKFRQVDDTFVAYTFFSIILPLIPTGCYRVRLLNFEEGAFSRKWEWAFYGSENRDSKEIACIYLLLYGFIIWLFCAAFAIAFSFV